MLSRRDRLKMAIWITRQRVKEYIRFDSKAASFCLFLYYAIRYAGTRLRKGELPALAFAGALFRHTQLAWCRRLSAGVLRRCIARHGAGPVAAQFMSEHDIAGTEVERLKD